MVTIGKTPVENAVEKYVEMSHGKTRYFEAGTGYPTILIHGVGYTGGGQGFFLNIGPLSSKLRVLAVDCLGWGEGDVLDTLLRIWVKCLGYNGLMGDAAKG